MKTWVWTRFFADSFYGCVSLVINFSWSVNELTSFVKILKNQKMIFDPSKALPLHRSDVNLCLSKLACHLNEFQVRSDEISEVVSNFVKKGLQRAEILF